MVSSERKTFTDRALYFSIFLNKEKIWEEQLRMSSVNIGLPPWPMRKENGLLHLMIKNARVSVLHRWGKLNISCIQIMKKWKQVHHSIPFHAVAPHRKKEDRDVTRNWACIIIACLPTYPEAEFINIQFRWGFLGIILRVLRHEVSVCNV